MGAHTGATVDGKPDEAPAPQRRSILDIDLNAGIGIILSLLGFLVGSRLISDNSFFTHFATGGVMLETGSVPVVDPYSATAAGQPWTVQSWFPSLVYRILVESAGFWAVRLFNGILTASLTAMIWRLTGPARHPAMRVALTGAAVVVGSSLWTPRPLLFGLVGLAIVLLVLRGHAPHWVLIPAMWVWVNSNGSFPLAIALVCAMVVGAVIDDRQLPVRELRVLAWTVAGVLVGALNPLGPRLLWFPIELMLKQEALAHVAEWKSPTFETPTQLTFLGLVFALFVAARLGGSWRMLLAGFGFVVMGLLALRNLGPGSIVLAAVAAPGLVVRAGSFDGSERGTLPRVLGACGIAGFCVMFAIVATSPALRLDAYPVEEVTWLENEGLVATPDALLIQRDMVGNYLELRYGSDANVFMDDRFDFYPQDVLDDHADLFFGRNIEAILTRRGADAVLWESDSELASWLRAASDDWDVAIDNEDWLVAVRAGR